MRGLNLLVGVLPPLVSNQPGGQVRVELGEDRMLPRHVVVEGRGVGVDLVLDAQPVLVDDHRRKPDGDGLRTPAIAGQVRSALTRDPRLAIVVPGRVGTCQAAGSLVDGDHARVQVGLGPELAGVVPGTVTGRLGGRGNRCHALDTCGAGQDLRTLRNSSSAAAVDRTAVTIKDTTGTTRTLRDTTTSPTATPTANITWNRDSQVAAISDFNDSRIM